MRVILFDVCTQRVHQYTDGVRNRRVEELSSKKNEGEIDFETPPNDSHYSSGVATSDTTIVCGTAAFGRRGETKETKGILKNSRGRKMSFLLKIKQDMYFPREPPTSYPVTKTFVPDESALLVPSIFCLKLEKSASMSSCDSTVALSTCYASDESQQEVTRATTIVVPISLNPYGSDDVCPKSKRLKKRRKRTAAAAAVGGMTVGGLILGPLGCIMGATVGASAANKACKAKEKRSQRKYEQRNFQNGVIRSMVGRQCGVYC